jgi:hypothetical protein
MIGEHEILRHEAVVRARSASRFAVAGEHAPRGLTIE